MQLGATVCQSMTYDSGLCPWTHTEINCMTPPFLGGDVLLAVFLFLFLSFFLFLRNQNRMSILHEHYHMYSNAAWVSPQTPSVEQLEIWEK